MNIAGRPVVARGLAAGRGKDGEKKRGGINR